MNISSQKLAFLTESKGSERILLWIPLIQKLSQKVNYTIFQLDSTSNKSDKQNPLCKSEIECLKKENYSQLNQFDYVIIVDTPDQIGAYSCERIPVPYGCFFGGILASSVNEQIRDAKKKKVDFLLSDLLPSEIKGKLQQEDFDYFLETTLFSPPAGISSVEKSTFAGRSRCYFYDSSRDLKGDILHHSIKNLFEENENSETFDLAKIKSFEDFQTRFLNQNLKCILIHQLPVALMHFISDLCVLNAIDLKILMEHEDLSLERAILSKQIVLGDSISRKIEMTSLREALVEGLSVSENPRKPQEVPISSEIYDLGMAIHQKFDWKTPSLPRISGCLLDSFRANQEVIYRSAHFPKGQDQFSILRKNQKSEFLRNTIFHLDFLSNLIASKQKLEIEQELADQITELFVKEQTSAILLNSFFQVIHSKEESFLNSMRKQIYKSKKPNRKIKVLRLLFHCFFYDLFSNESLKKGIEFISHEDIGNEFKLLIEIVIADYHWLKEHFMEIFKSCEKVRFFKFLNLYLINSFSHHDNFLLFLREIYPKTKENLSPIVYTTTDLIAAILNPSIDEFRKEDRERIGELEGVSLLFKLAIQTKIHKKLRMFDFLLSRINKLNNSAFSSTENLILICLNLNSGNPEVIDKNCLDFIDKKETFNALEIHPFFYSLLSWILSNQLQHKQLLEQSEFLLEKYKPKGIEFLQFFHQERDFSTDNPDKLQEVSKILSECLFASN